MPAPRVHHGIRRGLEEYFSGLIMTIAIKMIGNSVITDPKLSFYLNLGFWMYVIGSTGILLIKMNYWNIEYTFGVMLAGVMIVYAFRKFIVPLDIVIYMGAAFYLYRKIGNKIYRRSYYRWYRW